MTTRSIVIAEIRIFHVIPGRGEATNPESSNLCGYDLR